MVYEKPINNPRKKNSFSIWLICSITRYITLFPLNKISEMSLRNNANNPAWFRKQGAPNRTIMFEEITAAIIKKENFVRFDVLRWKLRFSVQLIFADLTIYRLFCWFLISFIRKGIIIKKKASLNFSLRGTNKITKENVTSPNGFPVSHPRFRFHKV